MCCSCPAVFMKVKFIEFCFMVTRPYKAGIDKKGVSCSISIIHLSLILVPPVVDGKATVYFVGNLVA